ncbi:MAG: MOSC domain-containing protein [Vulcanimicrobiaceae bacterium]
MTIASGRIVSVNVSAVRSREYQGQTVTTGIFKIPVATRLPVFGVNVRGDDQADRDNHGGKDRALYAYAGEDYAWWEERLGRSLPAGKFGENLTLSGVDVSGALIGERWRAGTTEFQVTSPRVPCYKLAMTMDDPAFVREFARAARPGAYLSIVGEGDVASGDPVRVVAKPAHGLTLEIMFRIYMFERKRLGELLVPELPSSWRDWVLAQLSNGA